MKNHEFYNLWIIVSTALSPHYPMYSRQLSERPRVRHDDSKSRISIHNLNINYEQKK